MDVQKSKLQRALEEKGEFIKHLPGEIQDTLKGLSREYEKTFKLYKKQEKALDDSATDVTQGTQNLSYLENKGNGLVREIMNLLNPDSKQDNAIPDKGARPGSASVRPPKPKGRRYTDNFADFNAKTTRPK